MEKKKSNNLAVCIICGILTAFGIVASIISLVDGKNGLAVVKDIINLLISAFIAYYAFGGYRKPHGNLLKYIIIMYVVADLVVVYQTAARGAGSSSVQNAILIGLMSYVSGRLHRVKQNSILMGIASVILLIGAINGFTTGKATIGMSTRLIIWLDICVAYFLRYKEHKEAGLMDRVKE